MKIVKGLRLMVGLLVASAGSSAIPSASARILSSPAPLGQEMTISVHDYADVPSKLLNAAEEQAREIYHRAGLKTVWLNCSPKLEKIEPESCHFSDSLHLTLKITPRAVNAQVRDRVDVLGTAYPDDKGVGYFAYVFYDRVQELAVRQRLGHALLADVMAHEIGHLLLGSNSHSVSGIMCAHWNNDQLRNIGQGAMAFIPSQSKMMRDRLRTRQIVELARQPDTSLSRAADHTNTPRYANTIWYKADFKGGVYDPREAVGAFGGAEE